MDVVDKIYGYWFEGDQQINYKTKWFPEGTSEMQLNADTEVFNQFSNIFQDAVDEKLESWKLNLKSAIALIVLLDQFSRHIYRFQNLPAGVEQRLQADSLALKAANEFHNNFAAQVVNLTVAEYVFSLMPLRHTATIDNLKLVLQKIEVKEEKEAKSMELLNKFRSQTLRRLQHLQDRSRVFNYYQK
jgi:uncharacterized protein (DUF924 family)